MNKNIVNKEKRRFVVQEKSGFTLIEVIIAAAIIAFAIFATWRVITSSINSITRQDKQIKALHIGQACLGRLEGEDFSRVVPENWVITEDPATHEYKYTLSIYDDKVLPSKIFINSDDNYWYSSPPNGLGISNDDKNDGILLVDKDGNTYRENSSPSTQQYAWDANHLTLSFAAVDEGKEIQIYYRYYHLIDEGGTIPSDGEGRKKGIIKLVTDAGNLSNIVVEDLSSGSPITTFDYSPTTCELSFTSSDETKSVWIYYLPEQTSTDVNGDGYQDPTDDSIVGVVQGCFWDLSSGTPTTAITTTKRITVTEFWKQEEKIKKIELETFIQR